MLLIKSLISLLSILLLRNSLFITINATIPIENIDQVNFKHEIFSIEFDEAFATFKGYAFVIEQQHHLNNNTHSIQLEIVNSKGESEVFASTLLPSDYTSHMQYRSTSECGPLHIGQRNTTCFYRYTNVQFLSRIPLQSLQANEVYTFNLIIHLRNANRIFKTPIYSILNQNNYETKEKTFTFDAFHFSNQLQIIHSEIVVRNAPSLSGALYFVGPNCSTTYRNQLFYQKDSIYRNVYSVTFNRTVGLTYYELQGMLSTCINSRRTIIEGTSIRPLFINRLMVNLVGEPLKLHVKAKHVPIIRSHLRFFHRTLSDQTLRTQLMILNVKKK